MHTSSVALPSRRLALLCATAAALTFAAGHGRAADAAPPPESAASASAPKTIHFVYIENELREPGLAASTERDDTLADFKYYEMGRQFKERAAAVFASNSVAGDVTIVPAPTDGAALKLDFPSGDPVVTLEATGYGTRKQLFKTWLSVRFTMNLLEPGAPDSPRARRPLENLSVTLGPDPVLGALRIGRFGPAFADGLLTSLLDQLASKGLVALPTAKAVRPPPAS